MVETVDPVQLQKLRRLAQIKRDNGLAFYRPHAKQELFHAAGAFKSLFEILKIIAELFQLLGLVLG